MIWNCGAVYFIDIEKLYQPITCSFVARIHDYSEYSDQIFTNRWNDFQVALTMAALQWKNDGVLLMN